jgi:predicted RNA-binding protein with PUA-like domain
MATANRYWLLKSEPESFSIDDLAAAPQQTTFWDGVRNYQARNTLRDDIQPGDHVLFYHSSADPPAIVGTAVVVRGGYPDHTAWQQGGHHFDPKSTPENPIWFMVDIRFEAKFAQPLPLSALREAPALAKMELLRKGSRLSVQPVTKAEFDAVLKLAERQKPASAEAPKAKKPAKPAGAVKPTQRTAKPARRAATSAQRAVKK